MFLSKIKLFIANNFRYPLLLCLFSIISVHCDRPNSTSNSNETLVSDSSYRNILIYAAASLTDAIKEIVANFEKDHPDIKVNISLGSSAMLAKQITHGAPADIFLSANVKWMDYLQAKGVIDTKTRFEPLGNRLVIVSNIDKKYPINNIEDLKTDKVKRFAISDYNSVPAGIYAKQAFENSDVWEDIFPKLVIGNNTRLTMAFIERNEVDYGIVYITDAKVSENLKEVFTLPQESQPEIEYSFSITKNSLNISVANDFLEYITNNTSIKVFNKYGFTWLGLGHK